MGRVDAALSPEGEAVDRTWKRLATHFDRVRLDQMAIMPDHVHGIIWLYEHPRHAVTLGKVVRAWKASATREIRSIRPGFKWQTGYFDRIIRDRDGLVRVRRYIRDNHRHHGGNAT